MIPRIVAAAMMVSCAAPAQRSRPAGYRTWNEYGGGGESIRYSGLDQIHRGNVGKLTAAWTFDTGDAFAESEMQCNPIIVDGVLYATSPRLRVFALDAATGRLLWRFDPEEPGRAPRKIRNRGVTYWNGGAEGARIFFSSRHFLYALDARTGRPVRSFGEGGRVDLRRGLGRPPETITLSVNTPGVLYGDLLITGSTVGEDLPSAPGDIRAFDVRTGAERWSFHTIPRPGEFGYDTWPAGAWKRSGGANNWAGMSVDRKRGIVFVPTGSAAFDFYGADRHGDNLFANCLIALDAKTGRRVWHFQTVRHDVWDRDLPAPPSLVASVRGGRLVDAVAQTTKSGFVFVFERLTGKPLFPIEHRRVPASTVDGELLAPTQPFPVLPQPFTRQAFTEEVVTRRTPEAHRAVLARLRELETGGPFVPPSLRGGVIFPGLDGGAEWGGSAFDPESGLLYVNANERVQAIRLVERPSAAPAATSGALYELHCAGCHGADSGGGSAPSLSGIGNRMPASEITAVIREGTGRMPRFAALPASQVEAIVRFVLTGVSEPVKPGPFDPPSIKYRRDGRGLILDPDGYPGCDPPWGTLNAISMDTGRIVWKVPLGEHPELAARGVRGTGSENYGGPVVTAGGLVFIGATNYDKKFRAFDKATGKLLWETTLPAAGNATPAVYEVNGRQFVVIAAGGGKDRQPSGGFYVAFALPRQ